MADKTYFKPGEISCILGVEIFAKIFKNKITKSRKGNITAVTTSLGHLILGDSAKIKRPRVLHSVVPTEDKVNEALQTLWTLDSVPEIKHLSPDERACEEDFERNITRDKTGIYTVSLPFKMDPVYWEIPGNRQKPVS